MEKANHELTVAQRAAGGGEVAADGAKAAAGCGCQRQKFIHDPQDQFQPARHRELAVQTFAVRVNRVRRDLEIAGDGAFSAIVEHSAHNLKFPPRKLQAASDFSPSLFGKYYRAQKTPRFAI